MGQRGACSRQSEALFQPMRCSCAKSVIPISFGASKDLRRYFGPLLSALADDDHDHEQLLNDSNQ